MLSGISGAHVLFDVHDLLSSLNLAPSDRVANGGGKVRVIVVLRPFDDVGDLLAVIGYDHLIVVFVV
jgi:hypothetical protein